MRCWKETKYGDWDSPGLVIVRQVYGLEHPRFALYRTYDEYSNQAAGPILKLGTLQECIDYAETL